MKISRNSRWVRVASVSALCGTAAFVLGLQTAGDVQPFSQLQAAVTGGVHAPLHGDYTGDGVLGIEDVQKILEASQEYTTPTAAELDRADIDSDGTLTVRDALRVLTIIRNR